LSKAFFNAFNLSRLVYLFVVGTYLCPIMLPTKSIGIPPEALLDVYYFFFA
jgi:hypothetical protein